MAGKRHLAVRGAISVALLILLFAFGGFDDFAGLEHRIDWSWTGVFAFSCLAVLALFSLRWWQLLGGALTPRSALLTTAVGLGANMVLPARGGDLLRVYQTHRLGEVAVHAALARMFVEKVLDLIAAVFAGGAALVLLGQPTLGAVALGAIAAAVAVLALAHVPRLTSPLHRATHTLFRAIRLGGLYEDHLARFLRELRIALRGGQLTTPTLTSVVLWGLAYPSLYIAGAEMLSVNLSYPESLVLLLAGALSLALPAAPSGLGAFHAAIAGAFVLIGRPFAEGVLVATLIHAGSFIAFSAAGFGAYLALGDSPSTRALHVGRTPQ